MWCTGTSHGIVAIMLSMSGRLLSVHLSKSFYHDNFGMECARARITTFGVLVFLMENLLGIVCGPPFPTFHVTQTSTFLISSCHHNVVCLFICPCLITMITWEGNELGSPNLENCQHNVSNGRGIFKALPDIFNFFGQRTFASKVETRREWFFDMSKIRAITFTKLQGLFQRLNTHSTVLETLTTYRMSIIFSPLSTKFDQWLPGISIFRVSAP